MAIVYLARDPDRSRAVAIKVLPREFMFSPKFRARFEREAKVMISLQIPGIVPVYDFGEYEGQSYLVMHYMVGGGLDEKLLGGPISLAESSEILSYISPALDEAHRRKMIHRDLKPGNVLFDESNRAYLADFVRTRRHSLPDAVRSCPLQVRNTNGSSHDAYRGAPARPSHGSPRFAS
jgi:serine/threonine-protein kinase